VAENYAAAVIEFKNALQIDPQDAQVRFYLPEAYGQRNVFFNYLVDPSNRVLFT
jgi:hypothetical protein